MNQTQKQETYPQPHKNLKRQTCGFIITIVYLAISCYMSLCALQELYEMMPYDIYEFEDEIFDNIIFFTSKFFEFAAFTIFAVFFCLTLFKPEFLAGKPDKKKSLVLLVAFGFLCISQTIAKRDFRDIVITFAIHMKLFAVMFFMYFDDFDESNSCFNCFKPWEYETVQPIYPYLV